MGGVLIPEYALQSIQKSLVPCKKCFGKATVYEDMQGYSIERDFKISCEKESVCKTAIQTNNSPIALSPEKFGSLVKLAATWNAENILKLEWFPARRIPSSSELEQWDSKNLLRPLKRQEQETSTFQRLIG